MRAGAHRCDLKRLSTGLHVLRPASRADSGQLRDTVLVGQGMYTAIQKAQTGYLQGFFDIVANGVTGQIDNGTANTILQVSNSSFSRRFASKGTTWCWMDLLFKAHRSVWRLSARRLPSMPSVVWCSVT